MAFLTRNEYNDGTISININLTMEEVEFLDAGKSIGIQQDADEKLVYVTIEIKNKPTNPTGENSG